MYSSVVVESRLSVVLFIRRRRRAMRSPGRAGLVEVLRVFLREREIQVALLVRASEVRAVARGVAREHDADVPAASAVSRTLEEFLLVLLLLLLRLRFLIIRSRAFLPLLLLFFVFKFILLLLLLLFEEPFPVPIEDDLLLLLLRLLKSTGFISNKCIISFNNGSFTA